jgi:hypothetical protein
MRKKIFCLLLVLFAVFQVFSQQKVLFGLGMLNNNYIGDFTYKENNFLRVYPGVGLSAEFLSEKTFKGQLNTGVGRFMEQNDSRFFFKEKDIEPNNFVNTLFFYVDWRLRMQMLKNSAVQPYISAGLGIFTFRPSSDIYKNLAVNTYSRPENNRYSVIIPSFPLSIGMNIPLSSKFLLGLEYSYRITPTDYLDNIGQLGARKGNDALQTLSASFYFSPQPRKKEPIVPSIKDTSIFKPKPKDTIKIDTTILANAKVKQPKKVGPPIAEGDRGVKMAKGNANNIPTIKPRELILARKDSHLVVSALKIKEMDKSQEWLALNVELVAEAEKDANANKALRTIKPWKYEFKPKKGVWVSKQMLANTDFSKWDFLNKELIASVLAEKEAQTPQIKPLAPLAVGMLQPKPLKRVNIKPYPSKPYTVPTTEKQLVASTNNSYLHYEENKAIAWKEPTEVWEIPIQDDLEGIWTRLAEEAADANVWFYYNCLSDEQYEYIYIKFRVRKELIQKYNHLSGDVPNYVKFGFQTFANGW